LGTFHFLVYPLDGNLWLLFCFFAFQGTVSKAGKKKRMLNRKSFLLQMIEILLIIVSLLIYLQEKESVSQCIKDLKAMAPA